GRPSPCWRCRLCFFSRPRRPPSSPLFPYTTLFRSRRSRLAGRRASDDQLIGDCLSRADAEAENGEGDQQDARRGRTLGQRNDQRSEEHTSELQSRENLVCRLLLEKKKETHARGPVL